MKNMEEKSRLERRKKRVGWKKKKIAEKRRGESDVDWSPERTIMGSTFRKGICEKEEKDKK